MVFSSLEFLYFYLAASLLLYFVTPWKFRNLVLFIVSLAFYGWGEPRLIWLMVFTIAVNYVCGYFVGKYREANPRRARFFLVLDIVISLLILGFFKYCDFFLVNLSRIPFLSSLKPLGITLPIGISFYTFQTMSYPIDVYRGDARMQKNFVTFGTYVTLFPQLIAGPIVRYQDVDDQLRQRTVTVSLFASGARTFVCGLAKKVFLANSAYAVWETFRTAEASSRTVVGAWTGLLFYCFYIYFDFSGYSDMAIGLGKMLGFRFLENFNYPYISQSVTEFWRRWHISLGTWFREYVYIPLGGNRVGRFRMYRNLLIVWFLTGFWHGANWNYIIWGLYYGVLLILEKSLLLKRLEKAPAFFRHAYALIFIYFGWLIFAFEDMSAGAAYLGSLFGTGAAGFATPGDLYTILHQLIFLAIAVIGSTPLPKRLFWQIYDRSSVGRCAACVLVPVGLLLMTAYLVNSSYNPFLYFAF